MELATLRKNKINLSDYNLQQDIENRTVLADFSPFDLEILEEILFNPLKFSLKKLNRNVNVSEEEIITTLEKLAKTGLLTFSGDTITVDKEMRKYFEFQVQRFSPDFKPDMEFLQGLLKKVPIHVLPTWYSIPRSSNNIFESIVEKYLLTPQIFQRYLSDLKFQDPTLLGIISDLSAAPDFKVSSSDLISKYNLSRRAFEEMMILLEFSFISTVQFIKEEDHWLEVVTPFYEWHQYLQFLKETETPIIPTTNQIQCIHKSDFAFIEEMTSILIELQNRPKPENTLLTKSHSKQVMDKLYLLKFVELEKGRVRALESANEWLQKTNENKALFLYRHPLNRILSLPQETLIERQVREAEKSIKRVLHCGWVFFDEFIKGITVPLNEQSVTVLKNVGKQWKYTLPKYQDSEICLLKAVIFEWLFEVGIVSIGTFEGRDCFAVTYFGRTFFED